MTRRGKTDGPCNGGLPGGPFWRVIGSSLIYARETPDFTDGAARPKQIACLNFL